MDFLGADIDSCSIKELKAIIGEARLSAAGCFEKSELRDRAREAQAKLAAQAKAAKCEVPVAERVAKVLRGTGWPSLVHAAGGNDLASVRALVRAGADVDEAQTRLGVTPVGACAEEGNLAVLEYLAENGASLTKLKRSDGSSPAWNAAGCGNLAILRFFAAKRVDLHRVCTKTNAPPTYIAAQGGFLKVVSYLIDQGADINVRSQPWPLRQPS